MRARARVLIPVYPTSKLSYLGSTVSLFDDNVLPVSDNKPAALLPTLPN